MIVKHARPWLAIAACLLPAAAAAQPKALQLIPPQEAMQPGRPRIFLRPHATPYAIPLAELKQTPHDAGFRQMLGQLEANRSAAAQAMVWLLTGRSAAAERALERMRTYRFPGNVDTFHIYYRLSQFALAYDWLYTYPGFTPELKAEVRRRIMPLAEYGYKATLDHMFHNYIWMSAGGTALWALATAGEDERADQLFERIRTRFNTGLFPAWRYLNGLPSEPMGYWSLYVLTPGTLALLAAQSAFEEDLFGRIHREDGDWMNRQFDNLIHSTLPNMRYIPWGDLQSGPNGGVTHEMAGTIDALTWALRSPHGAYFSRWLAARRGLRRFYGETAIYYMLYTRRLQTEPQQPPLSFFAGAEHSGHFIARSSWDDDATIVAFTCTDHFGDHHHYDQGSFVVYRQGLLAVDPPVYRRVRGPQQKTENHNTLLIGGQPQRPVRGQWFVTIEDFKKNLTAGRRLETGDILFHTDAGPWAAVAGQFAQAYEPGQLASCVRQLLFLRPNWVVIVDQLAAPPGKTLPAIDWLLHLPAEPRGTDTQLWASNGKSWLRCRVLGPEPAAREITPSDVNTYRVRYRYQSAGQAALVHLLETGGGSQPAAPAQSSIRQTPAGIEVDIRGSKFLFRSRPPWDVRSL